MCLPAGEGQRVASGLPMAGQGAGSLGRLCHLPWAILATSTPLAFVKQLECEAHRLPVKCDFQKTCIFGSWCMFLFRADTALFIYFPWALPLEPSSEGRFDRL